MLNLLRSRGRLGKFSEWINESRGVTVTGLLSRRASAAPDAVCHLVQRKRRFDALVCPRVVSKRILSMSFESGSAAGFGTQLLSGKLCVQRLMICRKLRYCSRVANHQRWRGWA